MKQSKKPPIGVKPRYLVEEERIVVLQEAIERYLEANRAIPTVIFEEYNELVNRLDVEE